MQTMTTDIRRSMGCGYLPDANATGLGKPDGYKGPEPSVCMGYTTKLPEVAEVSRARLWWDKAQLALWCRGGEPTEPLMLCVEELVIQIAGVEANAMDEASKRSR
jgi:hypothetical protein